MAQIVLLGDNAPFDNVYDGDFSMVWGYWRRAEQSPYWKTSIIKGEDEKAIGLHQGSLFSMCEESIAESKVLNSNPKYQEPKVGDIINWSFGADLEYISEGTLSLSLVFGDYERVLAKKVKLKGSDKITEHFQGIYRINNQDASQGLPFVRVRFYSQKDIKVYLNYVNIAVQAPEFAGPKLNGKQKQETIALSWTDVNADSSSIFKVYRGQASLKGNMVYHVIGETPNNSLIDSSFIPGVEYTYVVTRLNKEESVGSNKLTIRLKDGSQPLPPLNVATESFDAEVKVSWDKSLSKDVSYYSVYRGDAHGQNKEPIAYHLNATSYLDFTPSKGVENTYWIYAHDYSGNRSEASKLSKAKVKMVKGASFSDLIKPMPIFKKLSANTWGAPGVVPRDIDNGIEDPNWSYWGGRPVKDKDGKYHMCVTRWPANATKGHWEWPNSTVAHVESNEPTGPYKVKDSIAYQFADGFGHNPDIVLLNDGSYLLYSLIDWEAHLFKSNTMNGPWKHLGIMEVDTEGAPEKPELFYRFYRNLSGVQLLDDTFLFVTKGGAIMKSKGSNPLGPYKVITKPIQGNIIIPEKYRNSNYEDPVLWKDDVQFHMIINAFWDYRAIYLRSPDGVNWKFNPGTAYTANSTMYEDGTKTYWYKLERPHILQDEFGRATHLSLAVIDVPKADDLARDNHNSKNIIVPLTKHKRLKLLNKDLITNTTKTIKILVISEDGFDAQNDINLASLKFGAPEVVDFGKGASVKKVRKQGNDLIIEFNGQGNGITNANFAGKLLGKTTSGELIIGYVKLKTKSK
ncbi:hypothetical protein KFZ70_14695 [Tamlana fucoidanivorans]